MAKSKAAMRRGQSSESQPPITYKSPDEKQKILTDIKNQMFSNAETNRESALDMNDAIINGLFNSGDIDADMRENLRKYNDKLQKLYDLSHEQPRGLGVATQNPAMTATYKRQQACRRKQLKGIYGA